MAQNAITDDYPSALLVDLGHSKKFCSGSTAKETVEYDLKNAAACWESKSGISG